MKHLWRRPLMLIFILALAFFWVGCSDSGSGSSDNSDDDDNISVNPPDQIVDDDGGIDNDAGNLVDEFRNAVPDPDLIELTIPQQQAKTLGETAWLYGETADFNREVNDNVLGMLSNIDEIISYEPTTVNDTQCIWGPWIISGLSPVQERFIIEKTGDDAFDYIFQWRPKDSDDSADWTDVWYGNVQGSEGTQRRGVGQFTIDFDAAAALDPTVDESGEITVPYDTLTDGRAIDVIYDQYYSEDEDLSGPVDANYHYHNFSDNTGEFIFDWIEDIHWQEYHGTRYAKKEHSYMTTQWLETGDGRADMVVTGGDLSDMTIGEETIDRVEFSECWGSDFNRTYYIEVAITVESSIFTISEEGDEEACVFEASFPETSE